MINEKKRMFIDEARKQFYENGYNKASLDMIAKACGVQKQSISYYFGSKEKLGQAVYNEIIHDMSFVLSAKAKATLGVENDKILKALPTIFTPRWYTEDEHVLQFFSESSFNFIAPHTSSVDISGLNNFNLLKNRYIADKEIDIQKLYMEYITSTYSSNGSLLHFANHGFDISLKDYSEYYFKLRFAPFIQDQNELNDFYDAVYDTYSRLDISIKGNFTIE